jgi:hypothetical protein
VYAVTYGTNEFDELSILMQGTQPTETLLAEAPLARAVVARISC